MSTKSLTLAAGLFLLMAAWLAVEPAMAQVRQPAPSPYAKVSEEVGLTDITIKYCRPGVKERTIWGEGVQPLLAVVSRLRLKERGRNGIYISHHCDVQ